MKVIAGIANLKTHPSKVFSVISWLSIFIPACFILYSLLVIFTM